MRSMDTDDRGAEPRTSETTPAAASARASAPEPAAASLPGSAAASARVTGRHSGALTTAAARRRYWTIMGVLAAAALGIAFGLLAWDNPLPITDEGFWLIAGLRGRSLVVLIIVALCHAFATVAFQTVTNNRIITPSIMGFESLYVAIQTATMYFFGMTALVELRGVLPFTMQLVAMIGLSLALYGWLLSGKYANVEVMLLVGIVIGGGLGAVATFMQRTLTPSEFDVLSARLFGSIANSDATYLPVAIPLCLIACAAIYLSAPRLNVLALGKDVTGNLGLSHRAATITILFFVSILMAVSVSMIGPMIFLGFLVAMLSYQFSDTYDHRYVLPMAGLLGFVILGGAYFILKNIFYAEGVVSIIIEVIGGGVFLFVIMRKGRL
ncbi:iron chelate uptake ABC transporter family permease subunit [Brevibacterium casei]|uniref:Iron chelate uptake ABC transporter family permease subunit n=1 Tax=Brevibacterium casei TaxID=33889 RepID=A0A7T2WNN8_9MICO|nr:iron chelate uptake ABC transporter family permease subunit [Brevibacterium casei]MCT1548909.1 iron chelate uptake ABC transporter family permease subunit [Brevibacterium casei]MCT1561279.1 iron chelate uptake ABC transporter family permease subunit [Brevibacterium casei]MCT2207825.1 iron chelate uptake ABC transporter family permease subunit [Brevibacterium casei]QPS34781.1 iron chelate uptake ABC transporter family permease subunit [Brevibacterium casei]